jgi:hypothetical protein
MMRVLQTLVFVAILVAGARGAHATEADPHIYYAGPCWTDSDGKCPSPVNRCKRWILGDRPATFEYTEDDATFDEMCGNYYRHGDLK